MDDPAALSRRAALCWAGAAVGGLAAGLAACTADSPPGPGNGGRPRRRRSFDGRTLDVTRYGAAGDGRTDDTAAITRALGALRSGDTLLFPQGRVFTHADVLAVTTAGVRLRGSGTLQATNESMSALQIRADDVTVESLHLGIRSTTQRWSAPEQHKLYLGHCTGVLVQDVEITGSAAAGLFCDGATQFRLDHVRVSDTRADGIHMTNGSSRGRVHAPTVARSGDDAVAVVSYSSDSNDCHDIVVTSPTVRSTTGGRGVSVVGGHDVHYLDIDVDGSAAASVYLACESGEFTTASTHSASVRGGRITGANTDTSIDHGAVLVYSGHPGGSVRDVVVADLAVSGTRPTASRQIGVVVDASTDLVSQVRFDRLRLAATPTPYQGDAPTSSFVLADVTAAGKPVSA